MGARNVCRMGMNDWPLRHGRKALARLLHSAKNRLQITSLWRVTQKGVVRTRSRQAQHLHRAPRLKRRAPQRLQKHLFTDQSRARACEEYSTGCHDLKRQLVHVEI